MMDSEISELLNQQNNKLTISQIDEIITYDPCAYHVLRLSDSSHKLESKWGGCWEFEYKK